MTSKRINFPILRKTIGHPNLPRGVDSLEEARDSVDDDTLEETLSLADANGYWLDTISDHDFYETEYTLAKKVTGDGDLVEG